MPVVALWLPSLPLLSWERAFDLSRKDVDSSLRTHMKKNIEKSLQNLPLHTSSLLNCSLVANIAQGVSGGEGGVEGERGACGFPWICCHHSLGRGLWWTGKLRRGPGLFLRCHSVCGGRETRLSIAGYKVLPVSQRPLPAARMWGGWVNE